MGGAEGFVVGFSDSDFGTSPVFSTVTTFNFEVDVAGGLGAGAYADPMISTIEYNVSGSLDVTPSGFPAFSFQLNHLFDGIFSPPGAITGSEFYGLNAVLGVGQRLRFEIAGGADFSDGVQVDELVDLGGGLVFEFNGQEVGTGRYHPMFVQLFSDGTGLLQNANNTGGDNPQDGFVGDIDVDFGEEYITNLTFDAGTLTIAVPEPGVGFLVLGGLIGLVRRRR